MARPFNVTPQSIFSSASAALNGLLNIRTNIDIVGIYDSETLQQVFQDARPAQASVKVSAKVMDHPTETGTVLSDHKIINPREIEFALIVPSQFYSSTYQQIVAAFNNSTLLAVQTKADVYQNMIISALPHEEDADKYDVITMSLRLREILYVLPVDSSSLTPQYYNPSAPDNQNTIKRGDQGQSASNIPASIFAYINTLAAWGS